MIVTRVNHLLNQLARFVNLPPGSYLASCQGYLAEVIVENWE